MILESIVTAAAVEYIKDLLSKSKATDVKVPRQKLQELLGDFAVATKALEGLRQSQEENKQLKEQIAKFDKWEKEKARYKLFQLDSGCLVYRLREKFSEEGIVYDICKHCYDNQRKSTLQPGNNSNLLHCPNCKNSCNIEKPSERVYTVPTYKG